MQVVGPGLGGALVAIVSAAYAVVVDVLSFLVSASLPAPDGPQPSRADVPAGAARAATARGRDRHPGGGPRPLPDPFTLQGGASNFALTGYAALLVLFLVRDLGLDPTGVGIVMSAGSVGGLVGAAVARRASARWGDARAMVVLLVSSGSPALLDPARGAAREGGSRWYRSGPWRWSASGWWRPTSSGAPSRRGHTPP